MNPAVWDLYVSLQTELAYDGWRPPALSEHAVTVALEFHQWLVGHAPQPAARGLLIGPGGINEVEALRRAGLGTLTVVTAFTAEAEALRTQTPAPVLVADMHDLPLPSGSVDLVYAANVLEHALSPYIALMELRRVAGPGAVAYYVLPSFAGMEGGRGPFHLHCLTAEVWTELLRKTGWQVEEERRHEPAQDGSHYLCFRCRAVYPPSPHFVILERLKDLKETPR